MMLSDSTGMNGVGWEEIGLTKHSSSDVQIQVFTVYLVAPNE
jgi:hypothetical protein